MTNTFMKEFIEQSIYRIEKNTPRIIKCLQEMDEVEIWQSPNVNSNSVANLLLHLCGNIRQYIISALGGVEDVRERDKEFSTKTGYTKSALLNELTGTISEATAIIKNIDESGLTKIYSVQGSNLSGIGIIIHVTEHYSYHTGQIVFWTKQIKNKDLGFYANIDLNAKNIN
ncbi:MAG: DinB family protein [Ginsengibacter sp.]